MRGSSARLTAGLGVKFAFVKHNGKLGEDGVGVHLDLHCFDECGGEVGSISKVMRVGVWILLRWPVVRIIRVELSVVTVAMCMMHLSNFCCMANYEKQS